MIDARFIAEDFEGLGLGVMHLRIKSVPRGVRLAASFSAWFSREILLASSDANFCGITVHLYRQMVKSTPISAQSRGICAATFRKCQQDAKGHARACKESVEDTKKPNLLSAPRSVYAYYLPRVLIRQLPEEFVATETRIRS